MSKQKNTDTFEQTDEERELNAMLAILEKERAELEGLIKTAQGDQANKLTELQKAFRARAKAERERFLQATDSEYWFCVCFQTRAQKDFFLKALSWDKLGDKYLDGIKLAEGIGGIDLPPADLRFILAKEDRRLSEISQPLS